ncbi:hypothetical protein [Streptomyces tubercidicus]|uniref:hypothetical protein n=1 Tax=Streptomyces tubercidicus TaxID=47759 RepID=UPI0036BED624
MRKKLEKASKNLDAASEKLAEASKKLDTTSAEWDTARRQLADPTNGLAALHREVVQSRQKILDAIQGEVTGLGAENGELRRHQDEMLADLGEMKDEIRAVRLELTQAPQQSSPTGSDPAGTDLTNSSEGVTPPGSAGSDDRKEEHVDDAVTEPVEEGSPDSRSHREQELKDRIEAAYQGAAAPTRQASDAPDAAPRPSGPPAATDGGDQAGKAEVAHGVLLLKAAGVASAELVLHRDTWEFLMSLAVGQPHFRTPPAVEDVEHGRVKTALSGRSLIAVLIALWETRTNASPLQADWALATTAYLRMASHLSPVTGSGITIRIVLDDGIEHTPPATDGQDGSGGPA